MRNRAELSCAEGWGDDGINKRPVIGFEVDAHSTGIRFNAARRASEAEEKLNLYLNAARNSEAENQQLRALLREEQERVSCPALSFDLNLN